MTHLQCCCLESLHLTQSLQLFRPMLSGPLQCVLIGCIEVVSKAAACMGIWHNMTTVSHSLRENRARQSPIRKLETYRKQSVALCGFLLTVSGWILARVCCRFFSALSWLCDYCCDVVTCWSMWTCHLLVSWLDFRVRTQLALSWRPHRPSIISRTGGTICPTPKKRANE